MYWLLAAFLIIPTVELILLLTLGSYLGLLETVLLILLTGTLGAWLAKREGLHVLRDLQRELSRGLPPTTRLAEGALVVAGGLLLITPGVFTDLAGFAFIFPVTRRFLAPRLVTWLAARFQVQTLGDFGPEPPFPGEGGARPGQPLPRGESSPFDHPVA